jgi:isopenicillin-N epimerase
LAPDSSAGNHNAISHALAFSESIGVERKVARLRYLRDRWAQRLAENPKVKILHSPDPSMSAGIGFLSFRDADPSKIHDELLSKYDIVTARMAHEEYDGLRVTPNIYSTVGDIDIFADAVGKELKNA